MPRYRYTGTGDTPELAALIGTDHPTAGDEFDAPSGLVHPHLELVAPEPPAETKASPEVPAAELAELARITAEVEAAQAPQQAAPAPAAPGEE